MSILKSKNILLLIFLRYQRDSGYSKLIKSITVGLRDDRANIHSGLKYFLMMMKEIDNTIEVDDGEKKAYYFEKV